MAIDWIRVIQEMIKPLQRALFEMWLDSIKARDWTKTERLESMLKASNCAECPDCNLPIDPDESYCIPCRDRKRERSKSYERTCERKWNFVVFLHHDLAMFCARSPRDISHLAAELRATVKRLAKGHRSESSVWAEFERVYELVKDKARIDGRDKLLEKG